MRNNERSWRYFGLLALAFAAGAVRMDEALEAPGARAFHASAPDASAGPSRCDRALDAAWLGDCTHPRRLLAGQ